MGCFIILHTFHWPFSVDVIIFSLIWWFLIPLPHILTDPPQPNHGFSFSFYSSGRERNTIIIIHHTIVRAEPEPMTAIQGGEQSLSDSTLNHLTDSIDITQTPLMGGLLFPTTLSTARRLLLEPHKATGGATTQTLTTNVLPTPPIQRRRQNALQQLDWPWRPHLPWTANGQGMEMGSMCLVNRLWLYFDFFTQSWSWDTGGSCVYDYVWQLLFFLVSLVKILSKMKYFASKLSDLWFLCLTRVSLNVWGEKWTQNNVAASGTSNFLCCHFFFLETTYQRICLTAQVWRFQVNTDWIIILYITD